MGGVAQARDLYSDLQWVELTRQIVPRHCIIGSVSAVLNWPTKEFFRRRTRQAHCHDAFQPEVGSLPIVAPIQVTRIGFDGDVDDRNAKDDRRRTMPRFVKGGTKPNELVRTPPVLTNSRSLYFA